MTKLIDYIKGKRHGKEAHSIEREAMQDAFLSDAIDGFDTVKGKHTEQIEKLRKDIAQKSQHSSSHWLLYSGIAAALLLCFTIGGYFIYNRQSDNFIAKTDQLKLPEIKENKLLKEDTSEIILQSEDTESAENISYKDESSYDIQLEDGNSSSEKETTESIQYANTEDSVQAESIGISQPKAEIKEPVQESKVVAKSLETSNKIVRGKIVDEDNEPITGASVIAQNSKNGTITDIYGEFLLPIEDEDSIITASFIGFKTKQVVGITDKPILLAMQEDDDLVLDECVVTSKMSKKDEKVEMPEPAIGWKEYKKYLKNSLRRPTDNECQNAKGTVKVSFHIDENGIPYDYVIEHSICPAADDEAIRLVKEGCRWTCKSTKRITIKVKF